MSGKYFYGIELHSDPLLQFAEMIKHRVPRASWTDKDKLHITLLFRGDACPETNTDMETFHHLCFTTKPFRVKLRGLGTFNNRSGPRVLFARPEPAEELKRIHGELGGNVSTFTPHLTIAKLEDIGDAEPEFIKIATEYPNLDFGYSIVDELRLYQTQGGGRPYRILAWHKLCGSSKER